eukprot:symbB.v1.2.009998.t3/scaffold646.1/size176640/14
MIQNAWSGGEPENGTAPSLPSVTSGPALAKGSPSGAAPSPAPLPSPGAQGSTAPATSSQLSLRESFDAINASLQRLVTESNTKQEATKSLNTVAMILSNFLKDPNSDRNKKVNTSGARFSEIFRNNSAAGELLKLAGFQYQHPNFVFNEAGQNAEGAQRTLDLVQEAQRNIDQTWSTRENRQTPVTPAPVPSTGATVAPAAAAATPLTPGPVNPAGANSTPEAARPWASRQPPPGAPQAWVNMTRDINEDPPQAPVGPAPAHPAETLPPAIAHPAESEARPVERPVPVAAPAQPSFTPQQMHLPIAHPAQAASVGEAPAHPAEATVEEEAQDHPGIALPIRSTHQVFYSAFRASFLSTMAAYPSMPGMQTPMPGAGYGYGYGGYGYDAAYYDPSYGSAQDAPPPGIQLTKEQKYQMKQAKRAKKLEEANERCAKLKEKQQKQKESDAANFLIGMSIAYMGLGTLFGLTVIGPSWGAKEFTGLGAGTVGMRTSLFNMHIDISCDKSFIAEEILCKKVMKNFEGDHDMQRVQGNSCALFPSACEVLSRCYIASMPLFGCITFAVLSSYSAAFCLFTYSKSVADPSLRMWTGAFTFATPLFATGGIVAWALLMPDLGEIPRSWSTLASGFGAGGIIGHEETHDFQFGWTFFAACIIDLFMLVASFVWMCMFKRRDDEDDVVQQAAADQAFCDELEYDRGVTMPGASSKAANYVGDLNQAAHVSESL